MSDVKVTVRSNGPLRIEGPVTILDHDGRPFGLAGRTTVSLCRCGASENKPFCDGAHNMQALRNVALASPRPVPLPRVSERP